MKFNVLQSRYLIKKFIILSLSIAAYLHIISSNVYACTGLMLKAQDGSIVHGRTVEFVIKVDASMALIPRGYKFTSQTPIENAGLKYTTKYAAIGSFSFDNVKILDGLNEKGLSVGVFYFPVFAKYAPITSKNKHKALSPVDFPNWILTQFATVGEVRKAIENNKVVIVPTVMKNWGPQPPPFHYIVYDKTGNSIIIEPIDGKLVIYDNPLGVITNAPTFDWHMINLRNYLALNPKSTQKISVNKLDLKEIGQGNGMLGLPGDFSSPSRFIRAAVFSATAVPPQTSKDGINQIFHILNAFDIPIGVAREERDGLTLTDYTMFTTAIDPQNLRYYYKSYDDQTIRSIDLKKLDLTGTQIKTFKVGGKQEIVDASSKLE